MASRLVLATAALGVIAAGSLPAVARPPSGGEEAALVASFHDPGAPGFTNPQLDCPDTSRGGCAFAFEGTTVETGDLSGSTRYHGLLYPGDAVGHAFRWEVDETFTGTVAGCGRGTVRWTGSGYGDVTSFDVPSQSARMWGTLTIVRGSGARGLRGLRGNLVLEARAHAVPPAAQDGTLSGALSCNR